MTWYATSDIDDAFDATKRFLFPFDGWQWLKLAVVTFFLGGVGSGGLNVPSGTGNVDVPSDGGLPRAGAPAGDGSAVGGPGGGFGGVEPGPIDLDFVPGVDAGVELAVLVGLAALVLLLALAFGLCGAVMEFVLLDSLRTNEIRLRRYFRTRFWKGVRLFAFRLGVGLLLVIPIAALVFGGIVLVDAGPGAILGTLAVAVPLIVAVAVAGAIVLGLTTEFVAPVMLVENVGLLDGWRRFWPVLTSQWKQYGLYLVVRLILAVAAGILALLVTATVLVALLVLFGIVAGIVALGLGGVGALASTGVGLAVVAVLGFLFLVCALGVVLAVRIPVVTYFRCYALAVLGDTEPTFDLLGELRDGGDTGPTPAGE